MITNHFTGVVRNFADSRGMPNQRFVFTPHPVANMSADVCRKYLEGNDPVSGKPILEEIIVALTKPLTDEDRKTGFIRKTVPRLLDPDYADNLERLFLENDWTDGLPIILPTEERVAEMLKGTSHSPEEMVGEMRPSSPHVAWSFTVEKVAINAVMAGAKPEYFPVILAVASTGATSLFTSTNSFTTMVVVNGPIRNEIDMRVGIGALGPFNEANATIGRAWTLISKNLGNGGKPGIKYMGSQGNNSNYNNYCFPEYEEVLPSGWKPFHVVKGFKPQESVVSIFNGWSMTNMGGYGQLPEPQHMTMKRAIENFQVFGPAMTMQAMLVLDPVTAKNVEGEGFDTKEKFSQWLRENVLQIPGWYWLKNKADLEKAKAGVEPYASWLKFPEGAVIPVPRFTPKDPPIEVVVVGGGTQPCWLVGNVQYVTSASVDKWR